VAASTTPPPSVCPSGTPWRTQGGADIQPSQSPKFLPRRSDGAPRGTCLRPWAKVSGSQTDLWIPWHDRRAKDYPFPLYAAAPCREKDIAGRVGRPAIPGRKKTTGIEPHPAQVVPTRVMISGGPLGRPLLRALWRYRRVQNCHIQDLCQPTPGSQAFFKRLDMGTPKYWDAEFSASHANARRQTMPRWSEESVVELFSE
jgi:hypothetical protein